MSKSQRPVGVAQIKPGTRTTVDKKTEISSIRSTQFYEDGGAFFFVNNVEEKLPPGTYRIQYRGGRMCFVPEHIKTDEIIHLEHSLQDSIIADIQKFWTKKEIYEKFGLLHKRGVLLHGPQGSGKTAVVYQLCEEIRKVGGFSIIVDDPEDDGAAIRRLREVEPDRPILAIVEEIDMQIAPYNEADWASLLDGELNVDNIIWLATTNNLEKLHPRFRNRPSRFDVVVEVGMPTKNDRARYIVSKFKDIDAELLNKITIDTEGFSLAHLKEFLVSTYCLEAPYSATLVRLKGMIAAEEDEAKK
jgi:AAA+ superfamily predicted ATPase